MCHWEIVKNFPGPHPFKVSGSAPVMYAKPACVPLVTTLPYVGSPLVLAGVELATINTQRFTSSAARLGYQWQSGVSTVCGCKHQKLPLGIYRKE